MLLLAAAAIAASVPSAPARPSVQARVTIRILAGASVRLGDERSRDGFIARDTVLRTVGAAQPARLIEFE